ncbi:hypothetical protein M0802_010778 [Mischocyttarus mexicanus]|nr:hypothetical protein M0802_010778 [Mischocyttarus mexicanus]
MSISFIEWYLFVFGSSLSDKVATIGVSGIKVMAEIIAGRCALQAKYFGNDWRNVHEIKGFMSEPKNYNFLVNINQKANIE